MRELEITLQCCGAKIKMSLNEVAIVAQRPDEVRKNVGCPVCQKLVILTFEKIGSNIRNVDQEIIVM